MFAFRLPVSGTEVVLGEPSGEDDLLLCEANGADVRVAVALAGRLARAPRSGGGGESIDAASLTVTDLDVLLLRVRQSVVGDRVRADVRCEGGECGARVDIEFRITDYLAHHAPEKAKNVEPAGEPGWFRLTGTEVSFRLPTAADQIAVMNEQDALRAILARCVRPAGLPARVRARVESAMEALAPGMQTEISGACPECGAAVRAVFDPTSFVIGELARQASSIYEEIHCIAARYGWLEPEILALPRRRRTRYAEMIRAEGRAS